MRVSPPTSVLIAGAFALAACTTELAWTVTAAAPCEGARGASAYWGITEGECSPLTTAPLACGIGACPDRSVGPGTSALLTPGRYCFWSLRVETEGGACRLIAEDHASRVLPSDRAEVALDGRCVPPSERESGAWDALVESLAGCNPRCDPERCECPGSCAAGACPSPLVADRIALTATHACTGERGAHQLFCWGEPSAFGMTGEATAVPRAVDVLYNGSTGLSELAVGPGATCVQNQESEVYCFGERASEWPGVDTFGRVLIWESVHLSAAQVAVGDGFACAILVGVFEDGGDVGPVICWGEGAERRLGGDVEGTRAAAPIEIADGEWSRAIEVAAGDAHACAITEQGRLYCWGRNTHGQVDPYATEPGELAPRLPFASRLNEGPRWIHVAAGGNNTCAIEAPSSLYCWGENTSGPRTGERYDWEVRGDGYTEVSVGHARICARSIDGTLHCFRPGETPEQAQARVDSFAAGEAAVCTIGAGQHDVRCTGLDEEGFAPVLGHGHTSDGSNAVCP